MSSHSTATPSCKLLPWHVLTYQACWRSDTELSSCAYTQPTHTMDSLSILQYLSPSHFLVSLGCTIEKFGSGSLTTIVVYWCMSGFAFVRVRATIRGFVVLSQCGPMVWFAVLATH